MKRRMTWIMIMFNAAGFCAGILAAKGQATTAFIIGAIVGFIAYDIGENK